MAKRMEPKYITVENQGNILVGGAPDINGDCPMQEVPLGGNGQFLKATLSGITWDTLTLNGLSDVDPDHPPQIGEILGWNGTQWSPRSGIYCISNQTEFGQAYEEAVTGMTLFLAPGEYELPSSGFKELVNLYGLGGLDAVKLIGSNPIIITGSGTNPTKWINVSINTDLNVSGNYTFIENSVIRGDVIVNGGQIEWRRGNMEGETTINSGLFSCERVAFTNSVTQNDGVFVMVSGDSANYSSGTWFESNAGLFFINGMSINADNPDTTFIINGTANGFIGILFCLGNPVAPIVIENLGTGTVQLGVNNLPTLTKVGTTPMSIG